MSDFIPSELLIDVLSRLSVEDLIRSLTVCKSWYSLITSPSFISLHIQNQTSPTNNNNRLLLVRAYADPSEEKTFSIRIDNDTFEEYKSLDFPFKNKSSDFSVIGCFNGVVCVSHGYANITILWNPSIRKFVTLPKLHWYGCYNYSTGFAFIDATNDYKVVKVFHPEDEDGMVDNVPPEVEVYNLSTGYWRSVDAKGFPYFVNYQSRQAFLNGTIHWVGSSQAELTEITDGYFNMIVTFDMETEVLGMMEMPDNVAHDWSWPHMSRVSVFRESLSLIHPFRSEDGLGDTCSIWVMKQYAEPESWIKLFTIDLVSPLEEAFGFLKNGHALLTVDMQPLNGYEIYYGWPRSKLASYDPESKQVNDLGIEGGVTSFYVDNFVETLALLGVSGEQAQEVRLEDKFISKVLPPRLKQ